MDNGTVTTWVRRRGAGLPLLLLIGLAAVLSDNSARAQQQAKPAAVPAAVRERQERLKERNALWQKSLRLRAQGKLSEAIAAAEGVVAMERQLLRNSNPQEVAVTLGYLAELHLAHEDFTAARKMQEEVRTIQAKLHGPADWRAVGAQAALAHIQRLARLSAPQRHELAEADDLLKQVVKLRSGSKFREAIPLAGHCVAIRKQLLGGSDATYANALAWLGTLYKNNADYAKAETLLRQALAIRRQVLGERHPDYATSLDNLAMLYWSTADYAKAEPLYRQSLAIRRQVLGERHPDYAASLNNLAELYKAMGVYAQAEQLFLQALTIYKQALGEMHSGYATSLDNLAMLYVDMRDYAKAEPPVRRAVAIDKQVLGERHPGYASDLNNLAELYRLMGDYAKAEPLYHEAMEIDKQALGDKHPGYAMDLNNLAYLYYSMGDYAKAEPLFRQSLAIRKQTLGERHPDYAASVKNLENLLIKAAARDEQRGDFTAARRAGNEVLELRTKKYGSSHWRTVDARAAVTHLDHIARMTPQQQHELVEAGDLLKQVEKLRSEKHFREAVPLAERCVAMRKRLLGDADVEYVNTVVWFGYLYNSNDDYARAEPLYRQALALRKQAPGEKHPDYAVSLNNLAEIYRSTGDYAKAEPLYRQAMEIYKQVGGERYPDYTTSLNNLAVLYDLMGDYAKAEPLYHRALELRQQVLGERHPGYALSLSNLALLYQSMGEYAKAEPLLRRALEIRKQALGERHPDYAASLNNLAALYCAMGDYPKAEPLVRQAMGIYKQVQGDRHPGYAASLDILAALYKAMGDYPKAESLYRQVLAIHKNVVGERHPDYAHSLHRLAVLYNEMGDYAQAEPLARQVVAIRKQVLGERHPDYAQSLNNLAAIYLAMGDYARAEPLVRQAMGIYKQALGERHPGYANSLDKLAKLYQSMGNYAKAEPLFRQIMDIDKHALGDKHPEYSADLNNLAALYQSMGDYAKAEPLYLQSRDIKKQTLGERHPDYAINLSNLALLYWSMGDYAKAEPLYRQALEIDKQAMGEKHPGYAINLNSLALLKVAMREPKDAELLSRQALAITRQHLDLTSAVQSERQQLAITEKTRWILDGYLSVSMAVGTPADQVYTEVLASKGAVWTRQQGMRRMRQDPALTAKPEVAKLYADLERTSRALANLLGSRPDPQHPDEHRHKLESTSEEVERLQQALAAVSQEYRAQRAQQNRTAADIQKALPRGSVLVDFLEYGHYGPPEPGTTKWSWQRRLAAFVVRPDRAVERLDLGPAAPIRETVEKWRASYSADEAANLKQRVWKPLEPFVQNAQTVLVSPDGALARFPLPALPGKQPGSYLLEDLAISVLPVPQMLPEMVARGPTPASDPASMLLVGEVDYDAAPGKAELNWVAQAVPRTRGGQLLQWPPLKNTRQEIVSIRDSFYERFPDGRCKLLRKDQAVVGQVRSEINRYRYVHFATHGFFAPQETASASAAGPSRGMMNDDASIRGNIVGFHPGLRSGLVLAGANRPVEAGQDDGILTALEVAELDLAHVDLATLSACETGLGKAAAGEGLLGLQRAFQVAGTHSVVATLWTIRDDAGRQLMIDFYENLWAKKMSKVEALRAAQLEMLREGVKRGLDISGQPADQNHRLPPWYWAGFVLSGDWR
jgi:tetratricopeptide (TPR) repeat protein